MQALSAAIVRVVILVTNAAFFCVGGLVVYFGIWLGQSGWLDIADKANLSYLKPILLGVSIGSGVVVMIVALTGCVGAWIQNRCLLISYAIALSLALILFIALAVVGFMISSKAMTILAAPLGQVDPEPEIGDAFNQVYCGSELAYICNTAPLDELLQVLLGGVGIAGVSLPVPQNINGINSACQNTLVKTLISQVPGDVCNSCQQAAAFSKLSSITEWINDKCPINIKTLTYCIAKVAGVSSLGATNWNTNTGVLVAPYVACRTEFLTLTNDSAKTIAIFSTVTASYSLIVVIFACWLAFSRKSGGGRKSEDDHDEYDPYNITPNKDGPLYSNHNVQDHGDYNNGVYGQNTNNFNHNGYANGYNSGQNAYPTNTGGGYNSSQFRNQNRLL